MLQTTRNFSKNFNTYFTQYAHHTGLHGFKYLGEKNRSRIEKILWLIFLSVSCYLSIILTIDTWNKWNTSPVLVSFATRPTPISKIPFPAVTICSSTRVKRSIYNYTENFLIFSSELEKHERKLANSTTTERETFETLSLACSSYLHVGNDTTTNFTTIDYIMNLSPDFNETFASCSWSDEKINCNDLFFPTLTEDGLCYTFNMLTASEIFTEKTVIHQGYNTHNWKSNNWNLEDGYSYTTNPSLSYPKRAFSSGENAGLSVILKHNTQDYDLWCRGPTPGFRLLLHNPLEFPRMATYFFRARLDDEFIISVTPEIMTTSENLKYYEPSSRKCYFKGEKELRYFKIYTQDNCQAECLVNFTIAKCGCVSFNMPHDNETNFCGSAMNKCVRSALLELSRLHAKIGVGDTDNSSSTDCDCQPSCFSINYNFEASQSAYEWYKDVNLKTDDGKLYSQDEIQMTKLTIFFKDMQFITFERNELYGYASFVANCGGLLGLFIGFSFLSVVEILHFFTLRLFCNLKRYGKRSWAGRE